MKCLQNKQKLLCISLVCALTLIGCQQSSNRDYSGSSRVVDAKQSYHVNQAPVVNQVYNSSSSSIAMDQDVSMSGPVYTSSPAATQNTVYSTGTASRTPVAYVPDQSVSTVQKVPNRSVTYGSDTQVGIVKPYIPDESDAKAIAELNKKAEEKRRAEGGSVVVGNPVIVPLSNAPDTYTVVRGDTLYSIAFRYGLDFRDLAKRNNISAPYNINVGQVIRLNIKSSQAPVYIVKRGDTLYSVAKAYGQSPSFLAGVNDLKEPYALNVGQRLYLARVDSAPNTQKNNIEKEVPVAGRKPVASTDKKVDKTPVPAVVTTPVIAGKTRQVGGVSWMWPTQGKVIKQFSLAEQGNKGIDIAGTRGQQILSAADGQVVYAGSALRGYGNLIIINHDNEFLSAYAHNDALLVKEGQKVKRGQQIARMGSTDTESVRLHFEVRYRGQSVNPLSYLPK